MFHRRQQGPEVITDSPFVNSMGVSFIIRINNILNEILGAKLDKNSEFYFNLLENLYTEIKPSLNKIEQDRIEELFKLAENEMNKLYNRPEKYRVSWSSEFKIAALKLEDTIRATEVVKKLNLPKKADPVAALRLPLD